MLTIVVCLTDISSQVDFVIPARNVVMESKCPNRAMTEIEIGKMLNEL
jgi:hypothetical protein